MKQQIELLKEQYEQRVKTCTKMIRDIDNIEADVVQEWDMAKRRRLVTKRSSYRQIITDLETILKSERK